jgi:DNA-binding NtrC family response regulator
LLRHPWPGNVRELKNTMDRSSVTVQGNLIDEGDLFAAEKSTLSATQTLDWPDEDLPTATLRLEEFLIRRALERCNGNRAEAARMLNINRQLLYTKLKRMGLDVSADKTPDVRDSDD